MLANTSEQPSKQIRCLLQLYLYLQVSGCTCVVRSWLAHAINNPAFMVCTVCI